MRSNNSAVKWFTNGMGKIGKNRGKKALLPTWVKKGLLVTPFYLWESSASSEQIVSAFITHNDEGL